MTQVNIPLPVIIAARLTVGMGLFDNPFKLTRLINLFIIEVIVNL